MNSAEHVALITARDFKPIHGVKCGTCRAEAPTFAGICLRCFRAWKDANLEKLLAASLHFAKQRRGP